MTKAELVEVIVKMKNIPEMSKRNANVVVDAIFEVLAKAIKKDKRFSFPGFGTFTVRKRGARTGRNPQTGEAIKIAASKTITFKPSSSLKETL
ncbi:MAG: HU family DNA-binding protein [Candidatus Omnitrophota bacterium]